VAPPLIHWDHVEAVEADRGPLRGRWRRLGEAAGSVTVGLRRIEVHPGSRSTPVHVHGAEEEIFFVLGGSGLSWQNGSTHEVRAGDCLVHPAGGPAHTLIAGDEGLDVLAFGTRVPSEAGVLPRAGVAWLAGSWVTVGEPPHPWEREVAAGELEVPPPGERPGATVALGDVEVDEERRGRAHLFERDLGRAAGSLRTGLRHVTIAAGCHGLPPHCHSAEEELFVVLEGEGSVVLGADEQPVHRGHVIARPPRARDRPAGAHAGGARLPRRSARPRLSRLRHA
jgi:uncharacterized cupin superfamily protein